MLGGQGGAAESRVEALLTRMVERLEAIEELQFQGVDSAARTAYLLDKTTAGGSGIYTMEMPA